jgi:hypothetical protein
MPVTMLTYADTSPPEIVPKADARESLVGCRVEPHEWRVRSVVTLEPDDADHSRGTDRRPRLKKRVEHCDVPASLAGIAALVVSAVKVQGVAGSGIRTVLECYDANIPEVEPLKKFRSKLSVVENFWIEFF